MINPNTAPDLIFTLKPLVDSSSLDDRDPSMYFTRVDGVNSSLSRKIAAMEVGGEPAQTTFKELEQFAYEKTADIHPDAEKMAQLLLRYLVASGTLELPVVQGVPGADGILRFLGLPNPFVVKQEA